MPAKRIRSADASHIDVTDTFRDPASTPHQAVFPPGLIAYTAEQVADLIQCRASWLQERARKREIPFSLISGTYRFTPAHVVEILSLFEQRPATAETSVPRPRKASPKPVPTGVVELTARRPKRTRIKSA